MQKPPEPSGTTTDLADLGVIRAQGPDAIKFLQGQLSQDVTKLSAERPLLAGFHNPQGRVIALLRLVLLSADDILAILPRELAATVAMRLTKYVLRAKVKVSDDSANWRVTGVNAGSVVSLDASSARSWVISPADRPAAIGDDTSLDREGWRALDVAAGLPQVYASTSEEFVAQMLNLDVLGAIAFDKGCYTGQEIIARAHYRGRVKRRMQRFRTQSAAPLAPGDSGTLSDGRGFKVVEVCASPAGGREFLAVVQIGKDEEPVGERTEGALAVEALSLPYSISDSLTGTEAGVR